MRESMLRSFLQLIAGFSVLIKDQPIKLTRKYLEGYIEKNFGEKLVEITLQDFDNFYKTIKDSQVIEHQVQGICRSITKEFSQQERFLLLTYLINFFAFSPSISIIGNVTSKSEDDTLDKVAGWLKYDPQDYLNFKHFAYGQYHNIPQKQNLLIAASKDPNISNIPFQSAEGIKGYISFLRLTSANLIVFNYNGTTKLELNGKPIYSQNIYVFSIGFFISAHNIKPIYYGKVLRAFLQNSDDVVSIIAENITYTYPRSHHGIKNLSFYGRSGEMYGILGGSGVGKSTLIKLLSGNFKPNEGKVLINGNDITENPEEFKGIVGVLNQEECLVEELTVFENLYLSAKASMGDITDEDLVKLCKEKLYELELIDCQNNKIGYPDNRQLSGGQLKRLAIAIEIIRDPKILLVDEPTSGLSSADSEMVMNILKNIALRGKLVIINIHQPSSEIFKLFDGVLILDKGGIPIFIGHPIEAILHFKKETDRVDKHSSGCECCGAIRPEQIFDMVEERTIDELGQRGINRKISPDEWHQKYIEMVKKLNFNIEKNQIPKPLTTLPKLRSQFKTFFYRNLLTKVRNIEFLVFALLLPPFLSVIVSLFLRFSFQTDLGTNGYTLYLNPNIPSFLFLCILSSLFFGLIISCEDIIRDRRIISRESNLGLSLKCFYNSKVLFLLIVSAIQTFLFALPGVVILQVRDTFLPLWIILFIVSILGNLLGLILSSSLKSVVAIYILVPFLIIPQILFSGLVVPFDSLNPRFTSKQYVPIVGEIMPSRWASEALIVNFFMKNRYNKPLYVHNFKESELRFRLLFLIPELNELAIKLTENPNIISENDKNLLESGIKLLYDGSNNTQHLSLFDSWSNPKIYDIINLIEDAKTTTAQSYSKAKHNRDKGIESIYPNTNEGRKRLNKTKDKYHNLAIENLVRSSNTPLPLVSLNYTYIQKSDPIYQISNSPYGRSHFFAPFKFMGSLLIETYWFNVGILLIMIFTCYSFFIYNLIASAFKRFF